MRRNVWWSVLQLREREKGERKRQTDRVLLRRLCQMPRSPLLTWCQSSMRRNALGLILLFFFFFDTGMEHNEEKCQMLAFYFRKRNSVLWGDMPECHPPLKTETSLCEEKCWMASSLFKTRNQPSLRKNARDLDLLLQHRSITLWREITGIWPSFFDRKTELCEERRWVTSPPQTEKQHCMQRNVDR